MIVQITLTRNELFLLKEMLPIWKRYADGFVFMDDCSTDGTYEYLLENSEKFNILSVLRTNRNENHVVIESEIRQRLYDEAFKHSGKIVCLDTDEYLDGVCSKEQLNEILNTHKDTLFYSQWIQYTDSNTIRVDGKWQYHPVDRIGSYGNRGVFQNKQNHSEHLPTSSNQLSINPEFLFVAHLQWMDKKTVAIKQYYWKVFDYVNKIKHGVSAIDYREYDRSVSDFSWTCVQFPFPLQIRADVYSLQNDEHDFKLKFIRENVVKYNIPNLNDWGMNIHSMS